MKIEGFFSNLKAANDAVSELKSAGFYNATVNMNDHYIDNRNVQTNLPGTETGTSNADLTLASGSHIADDRTAPLAAASPMASGIGRFDEIADVNCRVVVEISENDEARAKKLIKDMGGSLENYHIQKPRMNDDSDIVLMNAIKNIRKDL